MANLIKTFVILFVFGMAFSMTSCKKCTTCTVKFLGVTETGEEVCGKDEVDRAESDCEEFNNDATVQALDPDASCVCD